MSDNTALLKEHLTSDVSTVCYVWIVERVDGLKLGFTDHDQALTINGVLCEPQTGFAAGAIENAIGLSGDTNEVSGILSADKITAEDINAHLYDEASVTHFLVNWRASNIKQLLRRYYIGEIKQEDIAFKVELRSFSAAFDQTQGRYYRRQCDADLGDDRCGFNLAQNGFTLSSSIVAVAGFGAQTVFAQLASSLPDHWFVYGALSFQTGNLAGQSYTIASIDHDLDTGLARISVLEEFSQNPDAGSAIMIKAGCDKSFEMCKTKFGNHINFRGFPHMPGNEKALNYLDRETELNGGPLVP